MSTHKAADEIYIAKCYGKQQPRLPKAIKWKINSPQLFKLIPGMLLPNINFTALESIEPMSISCTWM